MKCLFIFFFADKILVATGLPHHTSMVEIINFASPKLSWNFEATSQKKFLERSGCIGAVLQKQAHIYGGFKKIDNENPNGIEKEYIKGILEREKSIRNFRKDILIKLLILMMMKEVLTL